MRCRHGHVLASWADSACKVPGDSMAADDHAPGGARAESSRERELARNESFFRNVNEIAEENAWASDLVDFVCECSRGGCMQRISLTAREYEHIRAEGDHFVLVPG